MKNGQWVQKLQYFQHTVEGLLFLYASTTTSCAGAEAAQLNKSLCRDIASRIYYTALLSQRFSLLFSSHILILIHPNRKIYHLSLLSDRNVHLTHAHNHPPPQRAQSTIPNPQSPIPSLPTILPPKPRN